MGDDYTAIIDKHATREEARSLADNVLRVLIEERIVKDFLDPEATLGGGGYRPGDRVPELYTGKASARFWTLQTSGVELITEPWVNTSGIPQLQELACPHCAKNFEIDFPEDFGNAIMAFLNGDPSPFVTCPNCQQRTVAASWRAFPHLGFCNLAFLFWNWPLLYGENWNISIPALIERTIGHPVVFAYGKI
jgi:hypothetical protein